MASQEETSISIDRAQQIRLQRMMWGFGNQACTFLIALGLYLFEMVPGPRALEYVVAVLVIDLGFVALIKSNFNLRFRDPSMTAAQIIVPLWPAIYIMFFITDPQARTAFLLMATGGLLFGMFALGLRGMLMVGGTIVFAYLILLAALQLWAPQRIEPKVEAVIVFAYGSVLAIVAYLGSFIAGIRHKLRKQNQLLEELSTRDPLTHLPNRRAVMSQLAREVSRTERRTPEQDSLCISILDVDRFKRINDTWGHDVGDAVLCRIGDTLQQVMRQGDFIGRIGGEEFVIVLPETAPEVADIASNRVRDAVARLAFPELPDNEQVTVSQGVAVHRTGERIESTLKRADQALFRAKKEGRNKVVSG